MHRSAPRHAATHGTSRTETKGSPRLAVVFPGATGQAHPLPPSRLPLREQGSPPGRNEDLHAVSGGRGLPAMRIP